MIIVPSRSNTAILSLTGMKLSEFSSVIAVMYSLIDLATAESSAQFSEDRSTGFSTVAWANNATMPSKSTKMMDAVLFKVVPPVAMPLRSRFYRT